MTQPRNQDLPHVPFYQASTSNRIESSSTSEPVMPTPTNPTRVSKLQRSTNLGHHRAPPPPPPQPPLSHQPFPMPDSDIQTPSTTFALSEADIDRFATLFSPATPPATPTSTATQQLPTILPTVRPRKTTQSSEDSDFGAFVSVPPSQDPLSPNPTSDAFDFKASVAFGSRAMTPTHSSYQPSLGYFDQFTANAKVAAERNRRDVLDELLQHQDDPMYFLNNTPSTPPPPGPLTTSTSTSSSLTFVATPTPDPTPQSTDEALAEALASEMGNPRLIRVDRGGSVKVAPGQSLARLPLPPRLSGSASPPSISSPNDSTASLSTISTIPQTPSSTTPTPTSASASVAALGVNSAPSSPPRPSSSPPHPAHATLSRLSSSLVSLLPSGRPRSTAPPTMTSASYPSSAPSTFSRFSTPSVLTHGSPFAATMYVPPSGAPGFAGDRAWDRGFSDELAEEEKRGVVDPVGLGVGADYGTGHLPGLPDPHHGHQHQHHGGSKGKGVILVGRRESTVKVLEEDLADLIRPHLPALTKLPRRWTLLYSLDQHGISLNTLYARCEPRVPTRAHPGEVPHGGLLVIRDASDRLFGVWLSEGVRLEKGGGYYGSGDSFVWRYRAPMDGERQGRLEVYRWTGVNAYVALCEPGFISFGGGDGHYGLYLDASLVDGSSAACPTFGNPPLCGACGEGDNNVVRNVKARDVPFECVGLEVWGIGPG